MIKPIIASLALVSLTVFANPVSIVIGSTPGGATDSIGRKFEEYLESNNISVSTTNIGGAGGKLAVVSMYNKPNVVGFISNSLFLHFADRSVDPTKLEVLGVIAETPYYIVSKLPAKKVCNSSEKLLLGAGAGGITGFIASKISQHSTTILPVPYKGVRESVFDVAKGEIDLAIVARKSDILNGQGLSIIANTSNQTVNNIPSIEKCLGVKINTTGQFIVFVSASSTLEFKNTVRNYISKFVLDPKIKKFYNESNLTYVKRSPDETLQFSINETAKFRDN